MTTDIGWTEQDPDAAAAVGLRRSLHAAPELSGREGATARLIAAELEACGPTTVVTGLGHMGTGVLAVFRAARPGPGVLLRAELDALPITESNAFEHRSRNEGVAHKCGHDGHMATLVAVARTLARRPPRSGRVLLLFQPAEETGEGARAVLEDPRFLESGEPDHAYAFHNVPGFARGTVVVREGTFASASVGFSVRFTGRTSHASYPEHGLDPTGTVCRLVSEVNALDGFDRAHARGHVMATVCHVNLGGRGPNFGITPGEGVVTGVLRAEHDRDMDALRAYVDQRSGTLAADAGLGRTLDWHEAFATTRSSADGVDAVVRAAAACGLPLRHVDAPFRWSEDFGLFTKRYGGAFFGLGSGTEQPQLHDSGYDYPDRLLVPGARMYRALIDLHLGDGEATGNLTEGDR